MEVGKEEERGERNTHRKKAGERERKMEKNGQKVGKAWGE